MKEEIKQIKGGKWWKVDFHLHTPASHDYGKGSSNPHVDKDISAKDYLKKVIENHLDCIIVADHNTFAWIPKLREAMREIKEENPDVNEVTIFPGVEVNVNGNVHLLAIFGVETEKEKLDQIFGEFGYSAELETTTKTLSEVMQIVTKHKGIAIPAHVDQESGLFYNDIPSVQKTVLALEDLLAFELIGESLENQSYKERTRKVSFVSGSDSHNLSTIGSRYTWVKMGTPSIEALKLALYDNSDGVLRGDYYTGNPNDLQNRMYIKYIEINNARYAGRRKPLMLEFSPWMTSIIGGRGTGKSSIVQFMRMILDKGNELPEALRKEFEDFATVAKGRNELGMLIEDTEIKICIVKDGLEFILRWSKGEVYEKLAEYENKAVNIKERFPIRIFSQKQLFEMTKDPYLLLQYIDAQWNVIEWRRKVDDVKTRYRDCMLKLKRNSMREQEKRRKETELREIESKIKVFETEKTRSILEKQKEVLLAEQQAKTIYKKYAGYIDEIVKLSNMLQEFNEETSETDMLDDETKCAIENWEREIKTFLIMCSAEIDKKKELFIPMSQWFEKLKCFELKKANRAELDTVIEELKKLGVEDIELYPTLLKSKDELVKSLEQYMDVDSEKQLLEVERKNILDSHYSLISERITKRKAVIEQWNQHANLRILLHPMGNMEKNEVEFRNIIKKGGATFSSDILSASKDEVYDSGVVYNIATPETGDYCLNLQNICEKICACDSEMFGKSMIKHLNGMFESNPEMKDEIFMWIPDDKVTLELKVGRKYISIDAGSAGQRTSAILTLLLQISEEPLIIDQPEDDLDTKNITDFIVRGINEKKQNQQIIVVTHNPNIVVNTNSEQVIHMEFAGGEINASHSGALQEYDIRDAICDVMEGGKEALESRYYRITKALG